MKRDRLTSPSVGALFMIVLICWINSRTPYSPEPVNAPAFWEIAPWVLLYMPLLVLPLTAGWEIKEFGFTIGPWMVLSAILFGSLCAATTASISAGWGSAVWEAFARTGEEIFFRGFLIVLLLRLFGERRHGWLWACLVSSLLFALVHTQTFQPAFLDQYGSPDAPILYRIIERLLNILGVGLAFALVRTVTRSVLPGAIAHSALNGGILAVPFVVAIYLLVTWLAYQRGENILYGMAEP